jgi:hypothetical protein
MALALATVEFSGWLPTLLIWWGKPWLDRTVLFVLARAGFGQSTSLGDLWRAQRQVWWGQFLLTWTLRRLSLRRSFTQPIYQIEGLPSRLRGERLRLMRRRSGGAAIGLTGAFSMVETCLTVGVISLLWWFAPQGAGVDIIDLFFGEESKFGADLLSAAGFACVVLLLEPFYVAAGFGMYLNRRVELEAWDIEQEFRREFRRPMARSGAVVLAAALAIAVTFGAAPAGAQTVTAVREAQASTAPSELEVNRALAEIAKDPNLAEERKMRILGLKNDTDVQQPDSDGWEWFADLLRWFAGSARWLLWSLIAVAVGFLAVYLWRTVIERRAWSKFAPTPPPTHVQDLDIRPESLPDDVGAAARALWDRGEQRAALSLLYRGTVSRLVHVHGVPIRRSSTEGDCVRLAAESLVDNRLEYVARAIGVWQRAVYGGVMPTDTTARELCAGFAAGLDAPVNGSAELRIAEQA